MRPGRKHRRKLLPVVADGFHRTAFLGLGAKLHFFFRRRLGVDEGITTFFVTLEESRGGFATKVAVDTLLVDIEFADRIVFPFFSFVSHA